MNNKYVIIIGIAIAVILAAGFFLYKNQSAGPIGETSETELVVEEKIEAKPSQQGEQVTDPITDAKVKNARYESEYAGGSILLTNGNYEGEVAGGEQRVAINIAGIVFGDLNGDGNDDAAVTLFSSFGAGTLQELAVLVNQDGVPIFVDRVGYGALSQIQKIRIENGSLVVDLLESAPSDPACCPSISVQRTYELQNNRLKELSIAAGVLFSQELWWEINAAEIGEQSFVLYSSGKLIAEGAEKYERQLTQVQMDGVLQAVVQTGILEKKCAGGIANEYGRDTTIVVSGQEKILKGPECYEELQIIESAIGI